MKRGHALVHILFIEGEESMTTKILLMSKNYKAQLDKFVESLEFPRAKKEDSELSLWELRLTQEDYQDFLKQVSRWLTDSLSRVLMRELTHRKHWHLTELEYREIINSASHTLTLDGKQIREGLDKYFDDYSLLILEGYLTFRLSWFLRKLDDLLEDLIDEYLIDREFNEYLQVLKYFIDGQPIKIDTIHIVVKQGGIELRDRSWRPFSRNYLEQILGEPIEKGTMQKELLISVLISIVPAEIVVHGVQEPSYSVIDNLSRDSGVFEILSYIFSNRIKYCFQCKYCQD